MTTVATIWLVFTLLVVSQIIIAVTSLAIIAHWLRGLDEKAKRLLNENELVQIVKKLMENPNVPTG